MACAKLREVGISPVPSFMFGPEVSNFGII